MLLVGFSLSFGVLVACIVEKKPSLEALPCNKDGSCLNGYKCFSVPDPEQGIQFLCLSNGAGWEPYTGPADGGTEPAAEPVTETPATTDGGVEPGPEAGPEPGPEAGPEPEPEAGPEPGPEAGPESSIEATNEAAPE